MTWLWIPVTVLAAALQTVRNASQRSLSSAAGTLGATFVRFAFGLPFTALALWIALLAPGAVLPAAGAAFAAWTAAGAAVQLAGTALLLAAMQQRSFVVSMAYSKTEGLLVALFSALVLGEWASPSTLAAIVLASTGVLLLSLRPAGTAAPHAWRAWISPAALLGIGSGAGFALSAVCFRAAILELGEIAPWLGAIYTLLWTQIAQSLALGAYLLARAPSALGAVARSWRISALAGLTGALASMGWFTAFGLRNVADVRTLAMIEILFSYLASRLFFGERASAREALGIALLVLGLVLLLARL